MRLFFDSSALAKRFIHESGSEEVVALISEATELIVSVLCPVEILSGLNRLKFEKTISSATYKRLKQTLAKEFTDLRIVPVDENVLRFAVVCLERARLRTLDALQLASAKAVECDLFVSADKRQILAGKVLKLRTRLIGAG